MCSLSKNVNKLEMHENAAKQKNLMVSGLQEATKNARFTIAVSLISLEKQYMCKKLRSPKKLLTYGKENCISDNVLGTLLELSVQVYN